MCLGSETCSCGAGLAASAANGKASCKPASHGRRVSLPVRHLCSAAGLAILVILALRSPLAAAAVAAALAASYSFFLSFLVIKPSRHPRKSAFTDSKRRALSYPPVYPNAWYHLANSEDVKPGEVIQAEALGRKFAVWRAKSGELSVLDAFCPHGGANLCGGSVVGDALQCPFHLWEFSPNGVVSKVPWLEEPPASIKRAHAWTAVDWHGLVCVWFHADQTSPTYAIPRVASIDEGGMRLCGIWEVDRPVYMHIVEFMENTVDVQHFTPMHGLFPVPWTTMSIPGFTVNFASKVVLGSDHDAEALFLNPIGKEFLYFINESSLNFLGREVPHTTASVIVQFIGPALHRFVFTLPDLGQIVMIQSHLPLLENRGLAQKVRFRWFASENIPNFLASYVVGEWVSNWWADVAVWEEKIRRTQPALVKGDGPINRGRRWFKQFYSEGSEEAAQPRSFDW
mmetsp:Transcript_3957/g.11200  ORF Transcript_3957/g.11200 Transcript_3957/m.11200 type:complete len:455 (-) Transcript_3957:383-1747(-)|eukprot:CAMPEP_0117665080 /NCGR_PEP_ID=MMETSP0804-20121206/9606_1 /TAXON_ID=1074897 /ORGANISM="Tetraselmis astigmatica, Strain CCMP880" /LENGTH=454 /DNA_ID=CAMNT_0005472443 /DNA_START=404 /DNA_END=1768 /DNA_ORIENTATION=-